MAGEQNAYTMKSEVTGSGSPLVLVPGGLTGWMSWKPHAEQLSSRWQVIRVQLLAVELGLEGRALPEEYSVDLEIDALRRALDGLGIRKADFVAWSYGALVTLSFAINDSSRINSLTLIEPPAIWVLRSRSPLSPELLEDQKRLQTLGPGDVTEEQMEWFTHFAGIVPPGVDPRALPTWPAWVKHRQSLRTGDVVYRHSDSIERVRSFDKPVLLFKGEGSADFLNDAIDILGSEFPDAEVASLPGGHALQIISMESFMQILGAFLSEAHAAVGNP